MHGVKQPQAFADPIVQIAAVVLENDISTNVHFPKIGRRVTVTHPLAEHFANPTGRLYADGVEAGGYE